MWTLVDSARLLSELTHPKRLCTLQTQRQAQGSGKVVIAIRLGLEIPKLGYCTLHLSSVAQCRNS
jgi:hypothetical protein